MPQWHWGRFGEGSLVIIDSQQMVFEFRQVAQATVNQRFGLANASFHRRCINYNVFEKLRSLSCASRKLPLHLEIMPHQSAASSQCIISVQLKSKSKMMPSATAIQLPFWQDPQSPFALGISVASNSCEAFFTLWNEAGEEIPDCLGKITFSECWATRTANTDLLPYAASPHTFKSFLLEVSNSSWLEDTCELRKRHYYNWKHADKFKYHRHYVLQGSEGYLEVLASSFAAGMASSEECRRYAFLRE